MKIIITYLLFVGLGVYGIFKTDFVLGNRDVQLAFKYCSVPTVIFAGLFSYKATFAYDSSISKWKNALSMALLSVICSLTLLASFQGYILTINKFGKREEIQILGEVIKVNEKVNKNGSKSYSIDLVEKSGDTLGLKTPHGNYTVGSMVREPLIKGSLGVIYK